MKMYIWYGNYSVTICMAHDLDEARSIAENKRKYVREDDLKMVLNDDPHEIYEEPTCFWYGE